MARVELNDVSKVYPGEIEAVRKVSLVAEDGEFLVLVGPSGCGKSTTLRMIAGLEEVTSGQISIGDAVVNEVAPKDRNIAMVFQNYALYPHMSVYQNMAFGLKLRKHDKKEIDASVRDAAKILDIEDILDRKPKALSGGQRQRVALGRAIVRDPQVFLFDEPLSNLDAMLRVQMRGEIGRLHARLKTTMIYVTHDQVEAMTMGDRIVVMKDGAVQQIDTPIQLYREPVNKFVAGFIGSPSMNFINGTVEQSNGSICFQDDSRTISVATHPAHQSRLEAQGGKRIFLGIRPEDITESDGKESDGPRVSAIVDVVEPLGAETLVHFKLGGAPFIARLRSGAIPRVGETTTFNLAMESAHFFDPETEDAIV